MFIYKIIRYIAGVNMYPYNQYQIKANYKIQNFVFKLILKDGEN